MSGAYRPVAPECPVGWWAEEAARAKPEPCIGHDPACPCQDGDLCHYRGPDSWPMPDVRCPSCGVPFDGIITQHKGDCRLPDCPAGGGSIVKPEARAVSWWGRLVQLLGLLIERVAGRS